MTKHGTAEEGRVAGRIHLRRGRFEGVEAALPTTACQPSEKARAQGLNDFVVYSVISLTAIGSGGFHAWFGWQAINVGVTPFLVLAVLLAGWLRLREHTAPALGA